MDGPFRGMRYIKTNYDENGKAVSVTYDIADDSDVAMITACDTEEIIYANHAVQEKARVAAKAAIDKANGLS